MATKKSQRIFIWFITAIMVIGTVTSFVVLILSSNNSNNDQARLTELTNEYQQQVTDQTKQLSDKYYDQFKKYESQPAKFAKSDVKKLAIEDLKKGTGKTLKDGDTDYAAYYIGWTPDGNTFDQSIDGESLKQPLDPAQGTIEGFTEGVIGMKIGGVRKITIPAAQADGEAGSGDLTPPNTPLKFIIFAIERPKEIPVSAELQQLYQQSVTQ